MSVTLSSLIENSIRLFHPIIPIPIERQRCGFLCVDLSGVPANQRKQALRNYIARTIPIANHNSYILNQANSAAVWYWPQQEQTVDAFGLSPLRPESLFIQPPNDSWVAISCTSGFDLQQWQNGILVTSLYCEDETTLQQTCESLNLDHISRLIPKPDTPPAFILKPLQRAWAFTRAATVAAALIIAFMSYWGTQGLWYQFEQQRLATANTQMEQQLAPIVALREQVYRVNKASQKVGPTSPPLMPIVAKVIETLPLEMPIRQIKYAEQKLELRTALDETLGPELVAKLEALPEVSNVAITGADSSLAWLVLDLTL